MGPVAFKRLSERTKGDDAPEPVLAEGIPSWLQPTVFEWMRGLARASVSARGPAILDLLHQVERALRRRLDWSGGEDSAGPSLIKLMLEDQEYGLDVLDFVLHQFRDSPAFMIEAAMLGGALEQAGSAWAVVQAGDGAYALERRVAPTVAQAADRAMSSGTRAADHLRRAWDRAYGRHPDPSNAYLEAVKAVEAAGAPIIIPKDTLATLGKMIAAVEAAPAKWTMRFTKPRGVVPMNVVAQLMRLLWNTQLDRHGNADPNVPISVTLAEAQDAVQAAVTLVQWFEAGAVAPSVS